MLQYTVGNLYGILHKFVFMRFKNNKLKSLLLSLAHIYVRLNRKSKKPDVRLKNRTIIRALERVLIISVSNF